MTDEPAAISALGTHLKDIFLSDSEAYASIFGPDGRERRFDLDSWIRFVAWETGEYWLTARRPPGTVLVSQMPFHLNRGDTYRAKPLKQWEVYES